MSRYLAYCRGPADQTWTPPVHLDTPEACLRYVYLHHGWAPEIRITDDEDFLIMHVQDHILKIPWTDETLREFPMHGTRPPGAKEDPDAALS